MIIRLRLLHFIRQRYFFTGRFITTNSDDRVSQFQEEFNRHHIPITNAQRIMLGIGSALGSLYNPYRPEMIATMGEATGLQALKYMKSQMENDPEGIKILNMKPRINSSTVDLQKLKLLPEGTLGRTYVHFLDKNCVTPDSRQMVQFVPEIELAYVMQRYREIHDMVHTLVDMPITILGEVTVKWIEAFQTRLPLCITGGIFGAVRLGPKDRQKYINYYLPWAIETGMKSKFLMNVYFEERWEQPIVELLREVNITPLVLRLDKS